MEILCDLLFRGQVAANVTLMNASKRNLNPSMAYYEKFFSNLTVAYGWNVSGFT